jgi:hypothetical protein
MSEKFSLKYVGNVPSGYDVSQMEYTYDFIYLVLVRGSSIDKAIQGVANEYGLRENHLMDYLVENKYIIDKTRKNEFSNQLKKYNTKSLKKILKKHGLKTSGKRERIEKRIFENHLISNNYFLSYKSKAFYKNKKRRIRIYNDCLYEYYYFNEFNEFYMDNYRKKEAKIPVEFINRHIEKSYEDESHENYIANNRIMAEHFKKRKEYRRMLEHVLKNYCMNLNPIWKIDKLEGHEGILKDTYEDLVFLKKELSKNIIISNYYLVWDSFNFDRLVLSKYDGYRSLKDVLNFKDYDRINANLSKGFYENEDLKIKRITQKTLFDF